MRIEIDSLLRRSRAALAIHIVTKHIWLLILLASPDVAAAGWFGPSNYDECVLDSMKGVTSDVAASAITRSCREKFPKKGPSDSEVPASVVNQLDGRAGMTSYGYFRGTIYNGNKEWTITQMTIILAPKSKGKSAAEISHPREYNVDVTAPPLTDVKFSVSADNTSAGEFDWTITKARGYRSR